MLAAPFYSDKDSTLIKEESVRDSLGLLPIWSSVARPLEPHLSASISSYRGFSAILFIYHLEKNHLYAKHKPAREQIDPLRQCFKTIELLVEYFLRYELDLPPCYGSRFLNSNNKKDLTATKLDGIVANGLYQFYRGSCRRAGMLTTDWQLDPAAESVLENLCNQQPQGVAALVTLIEKHIDTPATLTPASVFADQQIHALFSDLFSSTTLVNYFKDKFFADPDLAYYAKTCHQVLHQQEPPTGMLQRGNAIKAQIDATKPDWHYHQALNHVLCCEPFLSVISDCFELLHRQDGKNFDQIADHLTAQEIASAIGEKAQLFLTLEEDWSGKNSRFKSLFELAAQLAGGNHGTFLYQLASYHKQVMSSRGADALLLIEDNIVRSIADIGPRQISELTSSLKNPHSANNGYYIRTTARIYRQLFAPKSTEVVA
jgi:hypothetical protein